MATVKLQDGKVILKNGKVSCSCCAEPGECCMYPAQALADGLYTAADLPDAVDFTYSASGNTFGPYTLTRTGTVFRGGPDDEVVIELIDSAGLWGSADGGGGLESFPCLINETFQPSGGGGYEITVEDQFADTYTVASCSYAPVIGASVTRVSLCVWQGTYLDPENPYADGPQNVYLIYCPGTFIDCGAGEIFENGSGVEVPYFYAAIDIGGSGGFFSKKTPHSNTPAGSYSGEFSISFS